MRMEKEIESESEKETHTQRQSKNYLSISCGIASISIQKMDRGQRKHFCIVSVRYRRTQSLLVLTRSMLRREFSLSLSRLPSCHHSNSTKKTTLISSERECDCVPLNWARHTRRRFRTRIEMLSFSWFIFYLSFSLSILRERRDRKWILPWIRNPSPA